MNIFHYVSQDHSTRHQICSPPLRFMDSGKFVSYVKQSVGPLIFSADISSIKPNSVWSGSKTVLMGWGGVTVKRRFLSEENVPTDTFFNHLMPSGMYSYLLTPWSRVFLEKLTGSAASQEIPRIFGTPRFITVPTSARHMSLSWANSIQSSQPPPTSWRSILILSSHLRLGLHNGLFPSGFPTRTLCTPLPTCPAHLILLDFTTRTIFGKEYRTFTVKKNYLPINFCRVSRK